jgi:hypothetical protein
MHAGLQIDDTIIMLASASRDFWAFADFLEVYLPGFDHNSRRELEAGGVYVQGPHLKEGPPGVKDSSRSISRNVFI